MATSAAASMNTAHRKQAAAEPRVRVVRGGRYGVSKARQAAGTAGAVLVIALFVGLIVSIVASQARITQLSGEIDAARRDLTNAQSYYDYLSSSMDSITNRTSVQDVAEGRLGLVKADPSQITYIRLEDESVIEKSAGSTGKLLEGLKAAALSLIGSFDP
ncbi:hypothetical protein MR475_09250 [bacterium]|uniref:hypothetical protein n=2 Tax=Gemmiger sp. TaxID=2049027 RepID=UPI002A917F9F|nr:hypothetical protein [Gemmiger sp.]MCI5557180.1 hypothetical protein [bacterium]MCI6175871.1 hypothetical protein [bacterium]MCI6520970.1 hypothetical protein [bacterium]MCI6885272.1 hypothetical protein [bacterium]MCI7191815.1 hypothetical protein [bacterium]